MIIGSNILQAIGNTSLVQLHNVVPPDFAQVFAYVASGYAYASSIVIPTLTSCVSTESIGTTKSRCNRKKFKKSIKT
jgi:hypothetical protein